ncbi:RNA-binding protein YlmH [Pullulanibacillus pueri]|uniref:RNA-binding protein S4 n=1 Tax=Pullulanibacillus pueri TaxID=1437324 RepID=A0A8J3EJX5_9BACL|nr:YlmH/Sll1252 family protein [Pullulanibacillus pueri]MBM7680151.1 RNA-binding protein YlmH [Pullulanibacillus pueri]GGH74599.1 RNA-binding protein S4 [Pullulanibacillus pueri]
MSIYEHFRPEEKPFIDSLLEWKTQVLERYVVKRTDFLDPRQLEMVKTIIGKNDEITLSYSGGYQGAERSRVLLSPPYVEDNDFGLALLEVHYPVKYASIDHRNLLGSLMGLGLKREKFGDLLFAENRVQCVVADEIADYVQLHLNKVGRVNVTIERVALNQILPVEHEWEQREGAVPSLRLDVVLSEIYHLSRSKVADLVTNGLVKVNWKLIQKTSFELKAGDYLSLRGFGRSRLISVGGQTKRGNLWITYGLLR